MKDLPRNRSTTNGSIYATSSIHIDSSTANIIHVPSPPHLSPSPDCEIVAVPPQLRKKLQLAIKSMDTLRQYIRRAIVGIWTDDSKPKSRARQTDDSGRSHDAIDDHHPSSTNGSDNGCNENTNIIAPPSDNSDPPWSSIYALDKSSAPPDKQAAELKHVDSMAVDDWIGGIGWLFAVTFRIAEDWPRMPEGSYTHHFNL